MRIEPTSETECNEEQEEIKWNNARHQNVSHIEILSEINQILTTLEQHEEIISKLKTH